MRAFLGGAACRAGRAVPTGREIDTQFAGAEAVTGEVVGSILCFMKAVIAANAEQKPSTLPLWR